MHMNEPFLQTVPTQAFQTKHCTCRTPMYVDTGVNAVYARKTLLANRVNSMNMLNAVLPHSPTDGSLPPPIPALQSLISSDLPASSSGLTGNSRYEFHLLVHAKPRGDRLRNVLSHDSMMAACRCGPFLLVLDALSALAECEECVMSVRVAQHCVSMLAARISITAVWCSCLHVAGSYTGLPDAQRRRVRDHAVGFDSCSDKKTPAAWAAASHVQ